MTFLIFFTLRTLRLLTYSTVFVVGLLSACFWVQRGELLRRLLIVSLVAICGGLAFLLLRWLIISVYDWFIKKKKRRIQFFTDRKLAIIEDVKANEKYNVARELIKKYGEKEEEPKQSEEATEEIKGRKNSLSKHQDSHNGNAKGQQRQQYFTPQTVPKLYEIPNVQTNRPMTPHRPAPIRPFVEQSRTPIGNKIIF